MEPRSTSLLMKEEAFFIEMARWHYIIKSMRERREKSSNAVAKCSSQYKRDIIELIGVDFDAVPKNELRELLRKCTNFLPQIMDSIPSMDPERVKQVVKSKLGMQDFHKMSIERAKDTFEQVLHCQTFRKNYLKRRSARMAVRYRLSLGSYMSKRLASPIMPSELKEELMKTLKHHFPFCLLNEYRINLMTRALTKLSMDAGEFLIKKGDFSEKFYYIQSGLFGTVVRGENCYVTEYFKQGECFGENNLFFGNVSHKTVKCLQAATVWLLGSKTFHSVSQWGLKETYSSLEVIVAKTPGLQGAQASRLVNALQEIRLEGNVDVLAMTPDCSLYIISEMGEVTVVDVNPRKEEFVRHCGPGDTFGRDRLFTTRFAKLSSARTVVPTRLFYITSDAFERLFDVHYLYKKSGIQVDKDHLFYRIL